MYVCLIIVWCIFAFSHLSCSLVYFIALCPQAGSYHTSLSYAHVISVIIINYSFYYQSLCYRTMNSQAKHPTYYRLSKHSNFPLFSWAFARFLHIFSRPVSSNSVWSSHKVLQWVHCSCCCGSVSGSWVEEKCKWFPFLSFGTTFLYCFLYWAELSLFTAVELLCFPVDLWAW